MRRLKHDARIDLTNWNLNTVQELANQLLQEKFLQCVSEAIEVALEDKASAFFPIEWSGGDDPCDGIGGPPVDDPDIMYIALPLGPDLDSNPHWSISLREAVESVIDCNCVRRTDGGPTILDETVPILEKMRDHFAGLAAMIDKELKIGR